MSIQPDKSTGLRLSPSPPEELQLFSCSYPNCGYKDKREVIVAIHESHHKLSFKRDFPCQLCPQMFPAVVSFLHHMSTHHADKLLCPFCPFRAADWTGFKPHIFAHSLIDYYVPKCREIVVHTTAPRCAICSITFTAKESLSEHLKECSRKLNPLPQSAKKVQTVKSQESLEVPKQTEESECNQTEKSSHSSDPSSSSIKEVGGSIAGSHNVGINVTIEHRCAICSITFTSKESLIQHLKECSHKLNPLPPAAKKSKTRKGQESFEQSTQMDESSRSRDGTEEPGPHNHIDKAIGGAKAQILKSGCGKSGKRRQELCCIRRSRTSICKRHLSAHRKKKSYKPMSTTSLFANAFRCSDCSLTFKYKFRLRQHQRTSCSYSNFAGKGDGVEKGAGTQRRRIACYKCTFTTLQAYEMRWHYLVHMTAERPFKCPNLGCDYRARWVENLRRHQQESCRGRQIESTTTIIKTEHNLGSDTECGDQNEVNGEDSSKVTLACMLCNFIADTELSALKHSCEHTTPVVVLNRI